jgi:hypothetical protein
MGMLRRPFEARLLRRVFAFGIVIALAGCGRDFLISPDQATPFRSTDDYSRHSCEKLERESNALAAEYKAVRLSMKHGIRNRYSAMNGQVIAINDQIRMKGCKIPFARIPGRSTAEDQNNL